eukprot:gene2011-12285_t
MDTPSRSDDSITLASYHSRMPDSPEPVRGKGKKSPGQPPPPSYPPPDADVDPYASFHVDGDSLAAGQSSVASGGKAKGQKRPWDDG